MKHKPKSTLLAGISDTVKPKHTVHFKKQSIISAKFSRKLPLNKRGKYAATRSLWKMCAIEREHSRYIVHTEATEAMRSHCRCAVLLSSEQRVMWPNEVAILKKIKRDVVETWRKVSLVSPELIRFCISEGIFIKFSLITLPTLKKLGGVFKF